MAYYRTKEKLCQELTGLPKKQERKRAFCTIDGYHSCSNRKGPFFCEEKNGPMEYKSRVNFP